SREATRAVRPVGVSTTTGRRRGGARRRGCRRRARVQAAALRWRASVSAWCVYVHYTAARPPPSQMTLMPGRAPHPTGRNTAAGPRIRTRSYPTCFPSTVWPQEGGLFPPCSPHVADYAIPPVKSTSWIYALWGQPGCRTSRSKNLCPLASSVADFSTLRILLTFHSGHHPPSSPQHC